MKSLHTAFSFAPPSILSLTICATMCDIFITNDERFADKFKAVAYYLDIPIQIIKWQDIDI